MMNVRPYTQLTGKKLSLTFKSHTVTIRKKCKCENKFIIFQTTTFLYIQGLLAYHFDADSQLMLYFYLLSGIKSRP